MQKMFVMNDCLERMDRCMYLELLNRVVNDHVGFVLG